MKKIVTKVMVITAIVAVIGCFALPLVAAETPALSHVSMNPTSIADGDDTLTMNPPLPPPIPVPDPIPPKPNF